MSMDPQTPSQLAPILKQVQPYLAHYGYFALFFGVLMEDFGLPVPGEALLIASAVWAALGHFNIVLVAVIGFMAAVLGDNIGFAIGHSGGRRLALRYGRYVFLPQNRLIKLESLFIRHGGKVIVVARFVEGLRQFNGFVAGTLRYPWHRFLIFNIIGAIFWVGSWSALAYYAGQHLPQFYHWFHNWQSMLLIVLPLIAGGALLYWLLHRT